MTELDTIRNARDDLNGADLDALVERREVGQAIDDVVAKAERQRWDAFMTPGCMKRVVSEQIAERLGVA